MRVDSDGCPWTRAPVVPARADPCGPPWTPLGDLRITRLGVRVPPGVLREAPAQTGFPRVGEWVHRAVLMPWERSSGAILCPRDGVASEAEALLKAFA